jgi:hypothetical protein
MTTDSVNVALLRRTLLALMSQRITEAASHVNTAVALLNQDRDKRAFDVLLEAEPPMHEARALLNTIAILMREE